ncbi:MAG: glycosyltransferase family 1 protein [Deltaproteobacteria bacterium]|nr:glycosyltransferase family 1 protein [Deltaproteobacteria bacterium]
MKVHSYTVVPRLPGKIAELARLTRNLYWSWDHEVLALFRRLDPDLWEESGHNPMLVVGRLDSRRLVEASNDEAFLAHLDRARERLDEYLHRPRWFSRLEEVPGQLNIAYFSAEYGLTECMPIYSGGLGVLAGDHLKAASDLGLPLVGMGLLYRQGYFQQYLNPSGWQQEKYSDNDFFNMPLSRVMDPGGRQLVFDMDLAGRKTLIQVWRADVGKVPLFLLDTNLKDNGPQERAVTERLYGGDLETRIRQEMVLGIGGMRALKMMGIDPDVCHMNEGHSAFLALERIRVLIEEKGLAFDEARQAASAGNLFTTHTPVPAGFDVFPAELVIKYLKGYADVFGLSPKAFMDLGRETAGDDKKNFNMAMLAIRLSSRINGVSQLHARVTRKMWSHIWPDLPEDEKPVGPLTNGIHVGSWISGDMASLLDRYLGTLWREDPAAPEAFARVDEIPDEELWTVHERRRTRLVAFARKRLKAQLFKRGMSESVRVEDVLRTDALTIGFARRFATYKRATLLFADPDRLAGLLNDADRPVQILFAGKAHPKDEAGKSLIRDVVRFASSESLRGRVVFLEDYDLNLARYMVQGVDLWLNTPRRPREASGTSGMKVLPNGGLNASILDGWWAEAFQDDLGWAIGAGEEYGEDHEYQDKVESDALYSLLENEIIPLFWERGQDGLPRAWLQRVKASMKRLASTYTTTRMVKEYVEWYYLPAARDYRMLAGNDFLKARELSGWLKKVEAGWGNTRIEKVEYDKQSDIPMDGRLRVDVIARLDGLEPEDVSVQLYCGQVERESEIRKTEVVKMKFAERVGDGLFLFRGYAPTGRSGRLGFSVRVVPAHECLAAPLKLGKVCWEQ